MQPFPSVAASKGIVFNTPAQDRVYACAIVLLVLSIVTVAGLTAGGKIPSLIGWSVVGVLTPLVVALGILGVIRRSCCSESSSQQKELPKASQELALAAQKKRAASEWITRYGTKKAGEVAGDLDYIRNAMEAYARADDNRLKANLAASGRPQVDPSRLCVHQFQCAVDRRCSSNPEALFTDVVKKAMIEYSCLPLENEQEELHRAIQGLSAIIHQGFNIAQSTVESLAFAQRIDEKAREIFWQHYEKGEKLSWSACIEEAVADYSSSVQVLASFQGDGLREKIRKEILRFQLKELSLALPISDELITAVLKACTDRPNDFFEEVVKGEVLKWILLDPQVMTRWVVRSILINNREQLKQRWNRQEIDLKNVFSLFFYEEVQAEAEKNFDKTSGTLGFMQAVCAAFDKVEESHLEAIRRNGTC